MSDFVVALGIPLASRDLSTGRQNLLEAVDETKEYLEGVYFIPSQDMLELCKVPHIYIIWQRTPFLKFFLCTYEDCPRVPAVRLRRARPTSSISNTMPRFVKTYRQLITLPQRLGPSFGMIIASTHMRVVHPIRDPA